MRIVNKDIADVAREGMGSIDKRLFNELLIRIMDHMSSIPYSIMGFMTVEILDEKRKAQG